VTNSNTQARDVECPACGAKPGEPCLRLGAGGRWYAQPSEHSIRRVLSAWCPVCLALPGERCTGEYGVPISWVHMGRGMAAKGRQ